MIRGVRHHPVQGGFSLLEVLVAFSILALAVTTVLSLFATGLRNTDVSTDYMQALTVAEGQLAHYQSVDTMQLTPGSFEGRVDGFAWQARVAPLHGAETAHHGMQLYRVDVTVAWGDPGRSRDLTLSTLRLGALP